MSTQQGDDNSLNAYATLLTRPTYLAGVILLAYTLYQHSPSTPLIILCTPETLPEPAISALRAEANYSNIILFPVEHVRLPVEKKADDYGGSDEKGNSEGMVAERFIDTWTKLRVFEVLSTPGMRKIDRLCFLDADMMVFRDPSPYIFNSDNNAYLDGDEGIRLCATHICVCNLDADAWAPASWMWENCAHSYVDGPDAIPKVKKHPDTMSQMNTGTFVFRPSPQLRSLVLSAFENTPAKDLRSMKFPDQDFLNTVFARRWKPLSWRTNALKTWRYWHPRFWRDDKIAVLHYIVDKPWAALVQTTESGEKRAGYKGQDGETHKWWWDGFERWRRERECQGQNQLLDTVQKYMASVDGMQKEEMRALGGGAQDFARKWVGG